MWILAADFGTDFWCGFFQLGVRILGADVFFEGGWALSARQGV